MVVFGRYISTELKLYCRTNNKIWVNNPTRCKILDTKTLFSSLFWVTIKDTPIYKYVNDCF